MEIEVGTDFVSVPERVFAIARRNPDAVAVRGASGSLTYGELEARTRATAMVLLDRLGPGAEPVVLLVSQDAYMVATVLGVLGAGKFFVVADPSQPRELLAEIVHESTARLVVTDSDHAALAREVAGTAALLVTRDVRGSDAAELPRLADPDGPGALYFTSGSTGRPKGVVRSQRHLASASEGQTDLALGDERFSLVASSGFSASLQMLLLPLVRGGRVSVFDLRTRPLEELASWLEAETITVCRATPSVFRALARVRGKRPYPDLRLLLLGGEASYGTDAALFRSLTVGAARLRVAFGATETGGVTHRFIARDEEPGPGRLRVGHPNPGVALTLLDDEGNSVPPGETGRIFVTSRQVALGYWRRPDLDAVSFAGDPSDPTLRTFRSGDLAEWRPDGGLAWIGRVDHQVKVRGQKVDVAAVEAALMSLDGVREAAVIAENGPSGTRLAAYLGGSADGRDARRQLAGLLPTHMVPSSVVRLDSLPRNAHGKIDRKSLPASTRGEAEAAGAVAPQARVPEALAALFSSALGRPVAPDVDFFDAGGDSLAAVALLSGISRTFGVDLPPTVLWEAPTLGELAAVVATGGAAASSTLVPVRDGGIEPPLFYVPSADRAFHAEHTDLVGLHELARLLGPEPPLFAFHYDPRSLPEGTTVVTVENAARRFVAALRTRQPRGPYRICGYSLGAKIAWEMAQQLQAAGEIVSPLILLDGHGPGYPRRRTWREPEQWLSFARRCLRVATRLPGLGLVRGVAETRRAAGAFLRRGILPDHGRPSIRWAPYEVRPYAGPVVLLRAEYGEKDVGLDWSDPRNGLGPFVTDLEVVHVPAIHDTVLRGEALRAVAAALTARL